MLAGNPDHFIVVLHHNGYFVEEPVKSYVNGEVDFFDYCDVDTMSALEVDEILDKLGYTGTRKFQKLLRMVICLDP